MGVLILVSGIFEFGEFLNRVFVYGCCRITRILTDYAPKQTSRALNFG